MWYEVGSSFESQVESESELGEEEEEEVEKNPSYNEICATHGGYIIPPLLPLAQARAKSEKRRSDVSTRFLPFPPTTFPESNPSFAPSRPSPDFSIFSIFSHSDASFISHLTPVTSIPTFPPIFYARCDVQETYPVWLHLRTAWKGEIGNICNRPRHATCPPDINSPF